MQSFSNAAGVDEVPLAIPVQQLPAHLTSGNRKDIPQCVLRHGQLRSESILGPLEIDNRPLGHGDCEILM